MNSAWYAAAGFACAAIIAAVADHRRNRRRDLDRIGWAPWGFIQIAAILGACLSAAIAMRL